MAVEPTSTIAAPPGMRWIPGGECSMGSTEFDPEERPVRRVAVEGFWIDERPVTAPSSAASCGRPGTSPSPSARSTRRLPGRRTRPAHARLARLPPDGGAGRPLDDFREWWRYVPGASWRRPGPARARRPTAATATRSCTSRYEDAVAYAAWAGKALPTEAEWEYAARGGLDGARSPGATTSSRRPADGQHVAGRFPWQNLGLDGYEGTSPVGAFPPNGYGLYDMAGNVWEWTADTVHRAVTPRPPAAFPGRPRRSQREGDQGRLPPLRAELLPPLPPRGAPGETVDTSTSHIGFRCIVRPTRSDDAAQEEARSGRR